MYQTGPKIYTSMSNVFQIFKLLMVLLEYLKSKEMSFMVSRMETGKRQKIKIIWIWIEQRYTVVILWD